MCLSRLLLLSVVVLVPLDSATAQLQPGTEVVLRRTFNTSRVVYVEIDGAVVSHEHDDSRLFPVPVDMPVRVSKLDRGGKGLRVEFVHQTLGKGKIEADLRNAPNPESAMARVLWHAFRIPSEPDTYRPVVVNGTTGIAHFAGSNHLPAEAHRRHYDSLESALEDGHRRCAVCFYETPRVSNYMTERQLGAECSAQARFYYPAVVDDALQRRIRNAGYRALEEWPLVKKGYTYSFELVRSDDPNAFACPAGAIFVTTGLLDVVETEAELEAVLAHEIGHVEMRHGYRQLKSAQKASFWGALAAVAVGAATGDDAAEATTIATLTAAVAGIASEVVLSGYSRRFEMESDSLASIYLQTHAAPSDQAMSQILRKINYSAQVRGMETDKNNAFSSHPHLGDRVDRAESSRVMPTPGWVYERLNERGDLVARLEFVLQSTTASGDGRGLELLGSIETTPLLGEKDKVKDMKVRVDGRTLKLDNKEDTEIWPGDGAGLIFQTDKRTSFLPSLEGMELKLRNVRSWRRVPTES